MRRSTMSASSRKKAIGHVFLLKNRKEMCIRDRLNAAGIETEVFQNKVKELAKNHNVDLDTMIAEEGSFEKALKLSLIHI